MTVLPTRRPRRTGSVIPMLAVCVIALFGFVALAIDLGMMMVSRTECQNAADAAALAGARTLDNRVPTGQTESQYDNQAANALTNAQAAVTSNLFFNKNYTNAQITNSTVGLYQYDTTSNQFMPNFTYTTKPSGTSWSAVTVTVDGTQPTYFGKVLGISQMPMSAYAVAVHRPRDISLVLDFTGSMGFASTFTYTNPTSPGRDSLNNSMYYSVYNSSDTTYPQFGHYQRYQSYGSGNPNNSPTASFSSISTRPHPFYQTGTVIAAPYVYSPGNFTSTTANGPPIVQDFLFDPSNASNPTNAVGLGAANANNLQTAFNYSTFDTSATALATSGHGPTPAPVNFQDQSDSPTTYVGDKWPRKYGAATGTTWDETDANGAAINAAELLGWCPRYTTTSTTSNWPGNPPARTGHSPAWSPSSTAYQSNWSDFRDVTWETYGYDMDVADYIARRGNYDPRTAALPSNTTGGVNGQVKVTPGKFQGYSMGPGYWGKTFFMWPPDPRASMDWRRKFFLNRSGAALDPTTDSDTSVSGFQSINNELFSPGAMTTLTTPSGNWQVNYNAVLAWIKSGPQVLPPNLRSGRVLYYSSIPSDVNTATGTTDQVNDKRFWKQYINYVLFGDTGLSLSGNTYQTLAGFEPVGYPENASGAFTPAVVATTNQYNGSDTQPYMAYTDNPSRPRMHFWFGPVTMMSFIANMGNYGGFSGTSHQAQCWQLKAGVNSALDDIKANHPNDLVGLTFFTSGGTSATSYNTAIAPSGSPWNGPGIVAMGQDWSNLKNALFFPQSLVNSISGGSTTAEVRPYDSNMSYNQYTQIPNAQNSTDPNSGLAMAYNQLAPSSYVNSDPTRRGRRGSSKIVIFETDGVPNYYQTTSFHSYGYESYYTFTGGFPSGSVTYSTATSLAFSIIDQMVAPMSSSNSSGQPGGLSMPSAPCRVYSIGFGDIFSTTAGPTAETFLVNIQQHGGTSGATDTNLPSYQIITGTYDTRIANLRTALERILQSGVQVTLIE